MKDSQETVYLQNFKIPLIEPFFHGNEWEYVKDCLDRGWVSSAGSYVNKFEEEMIKYIDCPYGAACMNGTVGLQIGLQVLGVKPDHHVIVPNATFVASANSVMYLGAEPIFIDAHQDDWQMDLDLLESFLINDCTVVDGFTINKKSGKLIKALVIVHVYGQICDMNRLMEIANRFNILVLEDASESLGATYKGVHSGTIGHLGVFSFNGNKIITTGGGGMIVSSNEAYIQQARHLITQAKVKPFHYYHDDIGYNYRLVNVLAAIGLAQLEQLADYVTRKKKIAAYYHEQLAEFKEVIFQKLNPGVEPNYWLVGFQSNQKEALVKAFTSQQIGYGMFWVPMNKLPMYKNHQYITQNDVSSKIEKECLCIPCSVNISPKEMELVCRTIKEVLNQKNPQ